MNSQSEFASLKNKTVLLLGASSGIGFATAKLAAEEGARIIIVSSNEERLNRALKQLPESANGLVADLSKEEDIKALFEQIEKIDHLVYTAGESLLVTPITGLNLDDARSSFNTRFWGAIASIRYGAQHLNPGGSILLTSGAAGIKPPKDLAVVASLCGAIEALVRATAIELAPLRVNCITPGFVKTNLWNNIPQEERENMYSQVGQSLLVKRVGEPQDIALTFIYLMKQGYITGQSIVVDGGYTLV